MQGLGQGCNAAAVKEEDDVANAWGSSDGVRGKLVQHSHVGRRECSSSRWLQVLERMQADGLPLTESHYCLCMHLVAASADAISEPLLPAAPSVSKWLGGQRLQAGSFPAGEGFMEV